MPYVMSNKMGIIDLGGPWWPLRVIVA